MGKHIEMGPGRETISDSGVRSPLERDVFVGTADPSIKSVEPMANGAVISPMSAAESARFIADAMKGYHTFKEIGVIVMATEPDKQA